MSYNTGNALGSTDVRDLLDNAHNLDDVLNDLVNDTWVDRFGVTRKTLKGYDAEFETDQAARALAFQTLIDGTGWSSLGAYGAGVVITSHTQTVDYLGQPYSLKPSIPASLDAPYVTTGVWATEGVNFKLVGDNSLRQDLADPAVGGSIVRMLGAGAGSIPITITSKLQETVSPKDKGAKGDGAVDDSAAINTANAATTDVDTSSGTYKLLNTVNYGTATYRAGIAVKYNSAASFAWRLGSGAAVEGGSFTATGGVAFDVLAGSIGASLRNVRIKNTSSANATGVNLNAQDIKDFSLRGAVISTEGYGFLTNSAGSIDGLVISDSFIQSKADCIELNAPGASHKHVVINGCVLRADSTRSDHAAGFAVGIAGVKGAVATGLVITESRWEAFHQEDATEQLVISGVAARDVKGDFYRGQTDSEHGTLGGRGAVVVGTSAKSYGANLGNAGIYMIYNLNGSLPGANSSCNRYEGFDWGILSGRADMMADANVLDRCGVAAVASDGGGFIYGSNLALSTGTLAKSKEGTYIGGVWSTTVPTVVLDTSTHVPGSIGTVLAEFSYRGKITALTASTTTPIDLFLLPKLMCGRLIVRVRGSGVYIYGSADVLWDGTTLTVTKALKDFSGAIDWSGKTYTAVDGQLRMSVVNAGAARDVTTDVIFKGEYYK